MGALVLAVVFLVTLAIGAALAKGVLTLMLTLIAGGRPPALASFRAAAAGLFALVR